MKRMTRKMADKAAKELANVAFDKKLEKAKKEELEFGDYLIKKYFPKPILECQKEFHKFFQNYSHIHIHNDSIGGAWGSHDTASSTIECPTDVYIDVSNDDFKKAQKCYNTYHNLCSEKQGYISDVSDALLTLKSESRIKEAFPEALPYLNFTDAMLPSPKYEKLRLLLK